MRTDHLCVAPRTAAVFLNPCFEWDTFSSREERSCDTCTQGLPETAGLHGGLGSEMPFFDILDRGCSSLPPLNVAFCNSTGPHWGLLKRVLYGLL